jgi:xanthosine utilization system XapX-like protein
LRDRVGPNGAVAAVTTLVGVSSWSFTAVVGVRSAALAVAIVAGVVVLSVVAGIVAERVTRLLSERSDAPPSIAGAFLGVLVAWIVLIGLSVVQFSTPWTAAAGISFSVAGAVAALGYDRPRSVWVPALGFAACYLFVDGRVSLALARLAG